jgi:hypothetical protein
MVSSSWTRPSAPLRCADLDDVRARAQTGRVVAEELRRLTTWSERHRRLLARILIALGLSVMVDLVGALLAWEFETGVKGSDIHGLGDAFFFVSVQLLTVSSSLKNPVTAAGKFLDVALEAWAIFVVTAVAGSFAAFFHSGDSI